MQASMYFTSTTIKPYLRNIFKNVTLPARLKTLLLQNYMGDRKKSLSDLISVDPSLAQRFNVFSVRRICLI